MSKPTTSTQPPVDKFTDGRIHVSIWQSGVKGAFRSATFQLRYKDAGGKWKTGTNYALYDLMHLESAAKEARSRIEKWRQDNKASSETKPGG